ncbi:DUF4349 domain-containing protein [Kibdelosporangium philippinense]|uniref:DUF4349 domain-containing protein n=1 Tax=Kibdelosporangium philippinense TaxID=211113 RepID=A0ABS8ZDF8_9PSEU|nr:DUF4349 domain-containing protein [Kibdelosporangium philippinense]MCE7005567.1 DUF4349 domain-containing protein [Kibdelosporangium philippinense]
MSRRKSGLFISVAGAALLLGLSACSSSGDFGEATSGNAAVPDKANPAGGGGVAKEAAPAQPPASVQERQLVQTARVEMAVDVIFDAVSGARAIATTNGGFTGQEESRLDRASITLRIPVDKFDPALRQLDELGDITLQHKQAEDVTEQVVDLDSRLRTQRESVARIQALLAKATSVSEIAQIESELTRRQSDLESLQGRRDALGSKAALSTVTVQFALKSAPPAPVKASGGFFEGLTDGWGAFGEFFTVTTRVLGAMLPFLALFGIPAGLWFYFRRKRRKVTPPVTESV